MFDTSPNRAGTSSLKWDLQPKIAGHDNLLPFGVADMDFICAPAILEAMHKRIDHGIFGYTLCPEELIESLVNWHTLRHNWTINPKEIIEISGIVPFLHIFSQFLVKPDETVIIQEPVYTPFHSAVEKNHRKIAINTLVKHSDKRWGMNFDELEQLLSQTGTRYLIFCSPHNPVCRVWERTELEQLAEICRKHDILVISDEIHADLTQHGHPHIPWLSLPAEKRPDSISLISPNKAFNIPGMSTGWAVIPNPDLRKKIKNILNILDVQGSGNPLSYAAAQAAWKQGSGWIDELNKYIYDNYLLLKLALEQQCPSIELTPLEGTYLAWIDTAKLNLTDDQLWQKIIDAGLYLSRGSMYGQGGTGHLRMNMACPRSRMQQGVDRLVRALGG